MKGVVLILLFTDKTRADTEEYFYPLSRLYEAKRMFECNNYKYDCAEVFQRWFSIGC